MKKEKQPFVEVLNFSDSLAAQSYLADYHKNEQKRKLGLIIAAAVPIFDIIIGLIFITLANMGSVAFFIWLTAAIVAYAIGGGLSSAVKFVLKVLCWSWVIIPFFPVDLVIAIFGVVIAGLIVIFLPIIVVLFTQYQEKKSKEAAEVLLGAHNATNGNDSSKDSVNTPVSAGASATLFCTSCGAKIDANSKFCIKCGAKQ